MTRGTDWWPTVGSRPNLVESISLLTAPEVVRLFMPGCGHDGSSTSWSVIAQATGVTLTPQTLWTDLVQPGSPYSMPWGRVPLEVVQRVRAALSSMWPEEPLDLIGWRGYAEASDWHSWGAKRVESSPHGNRWQHGEHLRWQARTWQDLENLSAAGRDDFPSAVIPHSGEFLIARPEYSDSLFISGPSGLFAALVGTGLEGFLISPRALIPVSPGTD